MHHGSVIQHRELLGHQSQAAFTQTAGKGTRRWMEKGLSEGQLETRQETRQEGERGFRGLGAEGNAGSVSQGRS